MADRIKTIMNWVVRGWRDWGMVIWLAAGVLLWLENWIFDPFVGSGTTSIEAKRYNVNSIGIEAHPFVHWVAKTKTNWDIDILNIAETCQKVVKSAEYMVAHNKIDIYGMCHGFNYVYG